MRRGRVSVVRIPALAATMLAALAAAAAPAAAQALLIRDVTLLDGSGAAARPGVTVEVRDGRVFKIHEGAPVAAGTAADRSVAGGTAAGRAVVSDGRGKYLIPGLIDTHVHLQGGRLPVAPALAWPARTLLPSPQHSR